MKDNNSDTGNTFESQLGRKDYWDNFYSQEIDQFKNNSDLIGEVWFGEKVQNKIVNFIKGKFSDKKIKILDVGCGNAAFLLKLAKIGFDNLYGMDYSEQSIQLAEEIIQDRKDNGEIINTLIFNLFQEDINCPSENFSEFNLIHDKGTLDAFLSSKENSVASYINYLTGKITKLDTMTTFILTSCNYAQSELLEMFNNPKFTLVESIPHQSFNFGGSSGQVVTTLVFTINYL